MSIDYINVYIFYYFFYNNIEFENVINQTKEIKSKEINSKVIFGQPF
jgi:hypothetical protein